MLAKCQVDEVSSWSNGKCSKCLGNEIPSSQNAMLMKYQVDEISSWSNGEFTKCLGDEMPSSQNPMFMKCQVDEKSQVGQMVSVQNA